MTQAAPPNDGIMAMLRASLVFGKLSEAALLDLGAALAPKFVRGGEVVYHEGDSADIMFFVVSGRLRVSRRTPDNTLQLYNEIRTGESVGEAGLILQQARAADITALRDSTLAVLTRENFESLMARHPLELNRVFAQAIFNHLRHSSQVSERRHAHIFVVVPRTPDADATEVAKGLTRACAAIGTAYHVVPESERTLDPFAVSSFSGRDRFDELEEQYDFLVYQTDQQPSAWTRRAFRQADQIVYVSNAADRREDSAQEKLLSDEPGYAMKRKHAVLLHAAQTAEPVDMSAWRVGQPYERVYPIRIGHEGDYARLARFLTGTAVGVVLGGGGARGFAHLGVLRALEESGIPIDLVGGNSMGALIGAQYACGVPLDEIRERTMRFARGGEMPTFPVISLVSGKRVQRDLRRMFGNRSMDALWRPYFAAACNLSRACTTVQDSGPLWRAVLASNSPVGLFPPVLHNGELLVDGAILENVPVSAMRVRLGTPLEKRRGNGTIIAIDVDVRDYIGVDPELKRLSIWSTIKGYFIRDGTVNPGIGDILYRASHIGGLNQRMRTIDQSDHYLEPPVAAFPLMGYKMAAEIAEVGYRYAVTEIGKWKSLQSSR